MVCGLGTISPSKIIDHSILFCHKSVNGCTVTEAARVLVDWEEKTREPLLSLSRRSRVSFSTIYKVKNGQREHFSVKAALALTACAPELLPLESLLGIKKTKRRKSA
jgi:hypothetical protein